MTDAPATGNAWLIARLRAIVHGLSINSPLQNIETRKALREAADALKTAGKRIADLELENSQIRNRCSEMEAREILSNKAWERDYGRVEAQLAQARDATLEDAARVADAMLKDTLRVSSGEVENGESSVGAAIRARKGKRG